MVVPAGIHTERLYLRSWRAEDATLLRPVLEANTAHLADWIPAHVSAPAPLPELSARLAGYAREFVDDRSWRYAIFSEDERELLGEISLFPRSSGGRVPVAEADRLEIGYWLRADVTGRGYATEAARAMLALAARITGMSHVEIRCDARNARSAAVPRRLAFDLAVPDASSSASRQSDDMVWVYDLRQRTQPDGTKRGR